MGNISDSYHKTPATKLYLLAIVAICLIGLIVRLVLIEQSGWKIDYDEAMIGLLTRQIMTGELQAFIPGQPTIGSIEAYFLTPIFSILGDSIYSFRLYSILINIAYILSSMSLGKLVGDHYTALIAGLFASIAPAYMLITGLKTWGATIETIIFGNLLFICVVKIIETDKLFWVVLSGFLTGLLFWGSWLSTYYIIPCVVILLYFYRRTLKHLPVGIATFFVGSFPLWVHNIINNWESFTTIFDDSGVHSVSRLDTLLDIATNQYPKIITGYEMWFSQPHLLTYVTIAVYTAGIARLLFLAAKRKNKVAILLSLMLINIPLIYTQSGYGANAFNPYSIDATGRYLLMIHSALPIGVALFIQILPRKLTISVMLTLLAINLIGITQINASLAFDSPYYTRQPDNIPQIIDYLLQERYFHIWTDVGIAQPLMFYSNGLIQAADFYDYHQGGIQRFPEVFDNVNENENTVFLVPILLGQTDTPLSRALQVNNIQFEVVYLKKIAIYVPDTRVNPITIIDGLGHQY